MKVLISGIACVMILGIAIIGHAHKVTITNQTDYNCGPFVYSGVVTEGQLVHLQPNETGTADTGGKCPKAIMGTCQKVVNNSLVTQHFGRCTLGSELKNGTILNCTFTCWSSDWFLRANADGSIRIDKE